MTTGRRLALPPISGRIVGAPGEGRSVELIELDANADPDELVRRCRKPKMPGE